MNTFKDRYQQNLFVFQSHLLGVFDNVNEVEFHSAEYDKIMAVISQEGEKLPVCTVILTAFGDCRIYYVKWITIGYIVYVICFVVKSLSI